MSRSYFIFLIIAVSLLAFGLTSAYLLKHSLQYSVPPPYMNLALRDARTGEAKFVDLKVMSALPMDTMETYKSSIEKQYVTEVLFHQNPVFMVWITLVSILIAIAAGSCLGFIPVIVDLYRKFPPNPLKVSLAFLCAILIVYGLAFRDSRAPGYYYPPDIVNDFKILLTDGSIFKGIEKLTLSLCVPALALIFLCGLYGAKINVFKGMSPVDCKRESEKLSLLSKSLLSALQVLSITVVFSVLTSTTLGKSIRATLDIKGFNLYPQEISFVYGMMFSVFLGIIYIPVHIFLQREHERLKQEASTITFENKEDRKDFLNETFSDKTFESGALDNLKIIFTVMAPLLSGLLPGIVDGFK